MNENELVRKLNSVGKKAFIMCFDLYLDYAEGKISKMSCVSQQVAIGLSNERGAAIRCGNAKAIFQGQMVREALEIISSSTRIPMETVNGARELLTTHRNYVPIHD